MSSSLVGVIVLLAVVAVAQAQEQHSEHENQEKEYSHEPDYKFEYKVDDPKTGDFKSHRESRKGDKVDGYYMLKEADGTIREVHYTSDKHTGFNAVVKTSGTPNKVEESKGNPKEMQQMVHQVMVQEHHGNVQAMHQGHVEEVHKHHKEPEQQHYMEYMPYEITHHQEEHKQPIVQQQEIATPAEPMIKHKEQMYTQNELPKEQEHHQEASNIHYGRPSYKEFAHEIYNYDHAPQKYHQVKRNLPNNRHQYRGRNYYSAISEQGKQRNGYYVFEE